MGDKRQIKGRDILSDLLSGMADSELQTEIQAFNKRSPAKSSNSLWHASLSATLNSTKFLHLTGIEVITLQGE